MTTQEITPSAAETTVPAGRNRTWIIGGLLVLVVVCFACFAFMITQYKGSLAAYSWIRSANNSELNQENSMLCEGSQAEQFGAVFLERYGRNVQISLSSLDEDEQEIHIRGEITIRDARPEDYEAIFTLGDKSTGFLGLLKCVDTIQQLQPHPLPYFTLGG